MGKPVPITISKLREVMNYRAQVNLNNGLVWAVLYNAMVVLVGPVSCRALRNELAGSIEDIIKKYFAFFYNERGSDNRKRFWTYVNDFGHEKECVKVIVEFLGELGYKESDV